MKNERYVCPSSVPRRGSPDGFTNAVLGAFESTYAQVVGVVMTGVPPALAGDAATATVAVNVMARTSDRTINRRISPP
ncbi:hypothetical protein GCM10009682_53350 [Luedemannella flava]|uniref:Uncharacterized protein n=1 Tax=Luedemannella flava TaxID=349316 RepID=A0ABP4YTC4_9ACTN